MAPVFDSLSKLPNVDWPRYLLQLADGSGGALPDQNFHFLRGFWGEKEQGLEPPRALLKWLTHNVQPRAGCGPERELLFQRDRETIELAIKELESITSWPGRKWYLFEGKTSRAR